jgi:hypothetical protein
MDDEYEDNQPQGAKLVSNDNAIAILFDTEERLDKIKHEWRGDILVDGKWKNTYKPLARDYFINKQITAMRSIIDKINVPTQKDKDQCKQILYESVKAFIKDALNEPEDMLSVKDMRTMCKTFEHAIELFLGLVEGGHGAEFLKDALAGLNTAKPQQPQKSGVAELMRGLKN